MNKILREEKDKKFRKIKLGILGKQILVLLLNGVILWLTRGPKRQSYILKNIPKEFKRTKEVYLNRAIKRLYQSKLIDYKENEDGTISIIISEEGKKKILMYKIENLKLKKQDKWDDYWRIIIFDIPEELQYIRRIFCRKLKEIGMYQLQKSVYIYPFECKDELDFVIEYFNLRPYVRFGLLKEIDNELHLRKIFDLI